MSDERGHLSDEPSEKEFIDKAREGIDEALERVDEAEERMVSNVEGASRRERSRRPDHGVEPG